MENSYKKNTKVKAINCTQCGSPIPLFGGHNVQMIKCPACQTLLDSHENYKAIKKFANAKRPKLPLAIGGTGTIKGINFVIIGIIGFSEYDEGESYQSYEFQLFSPTHGYAWLSRDCYLNWTFMREVKDTPDQIITKRTVNGTTFKARELNFKVIESGQETINYVEGELTYVAQQNDSSNYVTAIYPPYIYEISFSRTEVEYLFGEYLPAEVVQQAFKLKETLAAPLQKHPCEPPSAFTAVRKKARYFSVLCLIIAVGIMLFGNGKRIFSQTIDCQSYANGTDSSSFYISKPGSLMKLKLRCPVDNAWAFFDISVKKEGMTFLNISKEISYYHGYEGGESWSEGSRTASAYLRVPDKGMYTLEVYGEGGTGNSGLGLQNNALTVEIYENVFVSRYFFLAFVVFLLLGFGPAILKKLKEAQDYDD